MKKFKISNNAIRRLPRYLRYLNNLAAPGTVRVSSSEMGRQMGLTASQIRQDFSYFGEFGQQGYGYNVEVLRQEISEILGMFKNHTAVLLGIGNLGHALLENFDFAACGVSLKAAFDIAPRFIGKEVSGVPVYHVDYLPDYLAENPTDIAILTLPRSVANATAKILVDGGIRGLWNFTNEELSVSSPYVRVEDIHFSDSLLSLSYYLSENQEN